MCPAISRNFLVAKDTEQGGAFDPAEWERRCRAKPASFKVPRAFLRVESLPRTALGKVQKHLLPQPKLDPPQNKGSPPSGAPSALTSAKGTAIQSSMPAQNVEPGGRGALLHPVWSKNSCTDLVGQSTPSVSGPGRTARHHHSFAVFSRQVRNQSASHRFLLNFPRSLASIYDQPVDHYLSHCRVIRQPTR